MTIIIGGYLQYIAANFQWIHNEFGMVGYVNLMQDQGLFKEHEEDAKGHKEMPMSMRDCQVA